MNRSPRKYWMLLTAAIVGVAFVCVGLWLAALSNPARFSLDIRADRQIHIMMVLGFGCTIAGIGLLLTAVSQTTKSLPSQHRSKANIGVGIGFVFQLAGLYLSTAGGDRDLAGLLLILAGVPLLIWGYGHYAEGKGCAKLLGVLGVAGVLGLIVLMVLPDQHEPKGA